jgi:ABC-type Fe3+ transport system permease subunit
VRFITTVVLAALLLFLIYLVAGWIVDGYFGGNIVPNRAVPDSWAAPNSWSQWRDIFIVFMALFWAFAGFLTVILIVVLILLALAARRVMRENVAPAVDSLKDSLDNIRGTTEFAGETVVSPIIRVYSVVRGVRSGVRAVGNLPARVRGRKKGKK